MRLFQFTMNYCGSGNDNYVNVCTHRQSPSLSSEHTNTDTHWATAEIPRQSTKSWVASKSSCPRFIFASNVLQAFVFSETYESVLLQRNIHVRTYASVKWTGTQSILAWRQLHLVKSSVHAAFLCSCLLVETRLPPRLDDCSGSCSLELMAWGYMQKLFL